MKFNPAYLLGFFLFALLVLPVLALALTGSWAELVAGFHHPLIRPALWLSAKTTALALLLVLIGGTPLAWWLARGRRTRLVEALVGLPVVLPPAVLGVALLVSFGRQGPLGALGLVFTPAAVVLAQVLVAAPFYVQTAAAGFRRVPPDLLLAARSLGASPTRAFLAVAVPVAAPSLLAGAALAWARALGEFGATLLFAGNLPGRTQTMPLAIYSALEADVGVARALSLILAALALAVLVVVGLLRRNP